jgi:hypothetical protein
MQNVPHIVRERMKAATSAAEHPDANILTAFAERSLPAIERNNVLDHLSRCADCREVLALALPASEELQTVVKPSPSWLTWPSLRWGFVAAGIVLVGSLGLVEYQRHETTAPTAASSSAVQNEIARNEPHPAPASTTDSGDAAAERQDKSEPKSGVALDSLNTFRRSPAAKSTLLTEPNRVAPAEGASDGIGGAMGGSMRSGRALLQLTPRPSPNQAAAAPSAPPPPTETVAVQSESAIVNTEQPSDLPSQNGSMHDRASANYSQSAIGKAKSPVASQTDSAATAANALSPLPLQTQPGLLRAYSAPLPRWTISASGGLQRSYDSGKTWQDVDVNSSAAAGALSLVAAETTANKQAEKDSNATSMKGAVTSVATPLVFRAVSANGADVWAGGAYGALYHSLDAGLHWTRMTPAASGITLVSDILTVEFSDAQHGKLTTSASEVWTTANSGQTWHKQ